jgi:hypothetical protein
LTLKTLIQTSFGHLTNFDLLDTLGTLRTSLVPLPPTHPPTTPGWIQKMKKPKNKKKKRKESGYLQLSLSLPIQTRLLLFVQRWFLYGKRTTVGFRKNRMCNSHTSTPLERVHNKPYRHWNRP